MKRQRKVKVKVKQKSNEQKEKSMKELFLDLARPDDGGVSRRVYPEEFVGEYAILRHNNGCQWGRDNGPLGKEYIIERYKDGGRIVWYKLHGRNKTPKKSPIGRKIKNELKGQPCAVTGLTSNTEIDHKDGRYDDPDASDVKKQGPEHFQTLIKLVNVAKREHCKKCRKTGNRFDARDLDYPVGWVRGGERYIGTCVGCYWYDPREFRRSLKLKKEHKDKI